MVNGGKLGWRCLWALALVAVLVTVWFLPACVARGGPGVVIADVSATGCNLWAMRAWYRRGWP